MYDMHKHKHRIHGLQKWSMIVMENINIHYIQPAAATESPDKGNSHFVVEDDWKMSSIEGGAEVIDQNL